MEWAAAELFKATANVHILPTQNVMHVSLGQHRGCNTNTAEHYQFYPFMNVGHFALHPLVDARTKAQLAGYYRDGIENVIRRGQQNPYHVGVPFLWCSNNLVVAFITQVLLYERMTGDMRYHAAMLAHRDWLVGPESLGHVDVHWHSGER